MTTIPDDVSPAAADTLRAAVDNLEALTIDNRQYALDAGDLPDDKPVREDRDNTPYVVDGEQPMFSTIAVELDGDDARIAAEFSSRRGHWKERDYAGDAYDAMAEAGIDPPEDNPHVGVQFGSGGHIAVENILPDARGDH